MSQANNLLSMLADPGTQHTHAMADSDPYFVIDPNTRIMSNGSNEPIRIMQYDHNSVVLTFELPRFVDGHDMMLCNRVLVHWNNISEFTIDERAESTDIYDLRINPKDKSTVVCSWTVSRNSTQYAGNLSFLVQYKCVENDITTYEWHTDIYTNTEIRPGRNNSEQSVIEYTEVIEQWYNRLFGEGKDSVIADIATAAEAQKASIAIKGEEVLATIPEEYTETYNMAKFATRTRANAIVVTAEGESVIATDSSDDYLRGLHVYGRTEQVNTIGAQLFDGTKIANLTGQGITMENDGLGRIYFYGTSTSSFSSVNVAINDLPPGTYTISGEIPEKAYFYVRATLSDGTLKYYKAPSTFTLDGTETDILGYIYGHQGGVSFSGESVCPMLNAGSAALPWEPYSGGLISPCPEWPQKLTNIEEPTVELYGRNLFNQNGEFESKSSTFTLTAHANHGEITINGTSSIGYGTLQTDLPLGVFKKGETYRLSRVGKNFHVGFWFYNKDNVNVGSLTTENVIPITIPDNADHMSFFYAGLTPETEVSLVERFMLNLGTEALPWEPSVDSQSIALNYTLHAVPVESGGTYTNANGQQWVADEIDFERGVHIQRVGVQTFNNAFEFINLSSLDGSGVFYCGLSGYDPSSYTLGMLSDQFKFKGYDTHNAGAVGHLTSGEFSYIRNPTAGARIYFAVDGVTNKEEATSWLAINQPTVYFPLKNYIETPLTEEELFAFSKLHSNATVTTAMNSENAYMGLVYNADTKTYFENTAASPERIQAAVDAWLTKHFSDAEGVSF